MRRGLATVGISISMLLGLALSSGCSSAKPRIENIDARVTGIDWRGVTLAFDLDVRNPLPIALAAPGGSFGIDVADRPFVQSENIPAMRVASRSTDRISLPARFEYGDLLAIATGWDDAGEIPYRLHGALRYTVAGAPLELPFEHRDEVPVLRMPKIEIEDFESSGLSMQGASVSIVAEIENPNAFAVGVADLGYALSIGGVRVGDITARTPSRIGSQSKGELRLDGRINAAQAISGILKSRDLGAVSVDLTGALDTPFGKVGVP